MCHIICVVATELVALRNEYAAQTMTRCAGCRLFSVTVGRADLRARVCVERVR